MIVMVAETLSYINHKTLVESTKKDQQLQILKQVICHGWPERKCDVPLEVMSFWDFRDELSNYNGLIYRGERTVRTKNSNIEDSPQFSTRDPLEQTES